MIEEGVSVGMSANKIQKFLQSQGLGIKRKKLLAEVRSIKGLPEPKDREKYFPKKPPKAPKKWKKRALKVGQIYRGSLIISNVPLHSTPFNRHYLGFRLNIFSYDKNEVYSALRSMKEEFIKMVAKKLKSYPYADEKYNEQVLGTEKVIKINVTNPDNLNGRWLFAVEEKGSDIDSESGGI